MSTKTLWWIAGGLVILYLLNKNSSPTVQGYTVLANGQIRTYNDANGPA